ncbi:DNA sulfur modification protein DndD [Peribacillus simplex]|uniref:DNA sulfur modification protein DndD n=1 Tax=Peribacillus simplex TaxID=1478 RepID=UPI002989B7C2|nr:DNA sulfur modification protein DndD [Peribacillus simplex]MBX9955705.1 DNA sulfur modification protein DndD [Peribacillus simplex]
MKINEIQLTNIGAYRGSNTFDFRTENDKNVILIGGENGAGKTTLLNAIKLGLFGAYAFGFKTESADYYKRVKNILNNEAKKINENNFRIKLEFTLIDGYEKTDYILYRYWNIKNESLKETFEIIANGKHLTTYDKELFHAKLKEVMPPQLLDLCLFDGEDISRIVNEDLLSDYLRKLSKVVFNLDLFEVLELDLESYSNQNLDLKKMESIEKELYELNNTEKTIKKDINDLTTQLDEYKLKRQEYQDSYNNEKLLFDTNGGLVKAERENILNQIHTLEQERKQNGELIKEFVSTLLPFVLGANLLGKTRKQLADEESLHLHDQLEAKLSAEALTDILKSISSPEHNQEVLKNKILNIVQPEENLILIHDASFSESSLIENMYMKVNNYDKKDILNIIEENKVKLKSLYELRSALKINDTTNEFSEMIEKMEKLQKAIFDLDSKIKEFEEKLFELRASYESTSNALQKIHSQLKDNEKTQSSFLESQKIITLSKRFRQIQLKKKLQEVQIAATTMLRKILRKQNYISSIHIDENTYDIILLDSNKDSIEKTTLSAGEKQILLISLIWAIFKSSGRKVPFIFDTLLGRLDKTHKTAVLQYFIPNCGQQAIILSTDSEIDTEHYEILKPFVSKEYMLEFNVEYKKTKIIDHYFPFKKIGESV